MSYKNNRVQHMSYKNNRVQHISIICSKLYTKIPTLIR